MGALSPFQIQSVRFEHESWTGFAIVAISYSYVGTSDHEQNLHLCSDSNVDVNFKSIFTLSGTAIE
jgi:hypothetical protein